MERTERQVQMSSSFQLALGAFSITDSGVMKVIIIISLSGK
jgi:hypothetical protein